METEPKEVLAETFCEVLENMAFMFGEAAEEDELTASRSGHVLATMAFSGPVSGRLGLAVPKEMCSEIAANVLGVEPDDPQVTAGGEDALKELLNVTCGQVLTRLAGEEPVFDLSVPVVSELDANAWQALANAPGVAALLIDDSPALLRVTFDE